MPKKKTSHIINDIERSIGFYWHLMSFKDLEAATGVHQSLFSKIRKGERSLTAETMSKVAKGLAESGFCVICAKAAESGCCRECRYLLEEGGVL